MSQAQATLRTQGSSQDGIRGFASIRDLEVLRTLIAARKTTAAANELGISQPAVSRTIASLEERSGRILFRREGGRLVPTADALALYAETTPVFEALSRLDRFSWRPQTAEPLRVVAPPTIAHHFLQGVIAGYLARYPEDRIALDITTSPDVFATVADGKADIGISDSPVQHPALIREVFRRSSAVCALPAGHRLAERSTITAADLDGEAFVAFARRLPIRATLDRILAEAGSRPIIRCETATVVSAVELVREGVGLFPLNARGPMRQSSSIAYLHPLSTLPAHLEVWTQCMAQRLLIENGRVTGAETARGTIRAARGVVLACGAIQTPQLMMVSGLGPAAHLRDHGIAVVADLPHVGRHLRDHVAAPVVWETHEPVSGWEICPFEATMMLTLEPDAPAPDILFHFGLSQVYLILYPGPSWTGTCPSS
ncbi:MAG: LysR substrate-binding domain-containing protein [Alphaproteobacteria bacterium]